MALITVNGIFHDPNGTFPSSGEVRFTLSDWYIAADGHVVLNKQEAAPISSGDGSFTLQLESTADGSPTTRTYSVVVDVMLQGEEKIFNLGTFSLPAAPATQLLRDLLSVAVPGTDIGTHVDGETLSGTPNDSLVTFTFAFTPIATPLLFVDGDFQIRGIHYTLSGRTVTFVLPPPSGASIVGWYRKG